MKYSIAVSWIDVLSLWLLVVKNLFYAKNIVFSNDLHYGVLSKKDPFNI